MKHWRLTLSYLLILLVLGLNINSASYAENPKKSQKPSPSSRVLTEHNETQPPEEKEKAQPDQRGTDQSPLFIKIAPSPQTQEEAAEAKREKERKAAAENRVEITTWIVAGATAIQAIALFFTIRVMKKTARQQLRAYLHIEKATVNLNGIPEATIHVKNSGQTPAYKWYVERGIFLAGSGLPDDDLTPPNTPDSKGSHGTLGPGITARFHAFARKPPSKEQLEAILAGSMRVFIHGTIHYLDTFGSGHFTDFNLKTGKLANLSGELTLCEDGNDAD